jgi:parvulin-like peptidyl-prolyl isomerase
MRLLLLPLLTMSLVAQTPAPEAAKPEAPKPESAAPAPAPKAAPAKPATPAQPKVDKILARVDGKVIRESDLDAYIAIAYNEQQRMQIAMIEGARKQIQDQFLQARLIAAKARREKLDQTELFGKRREMSEMELLVRAMFERDGEKLQGQLSLKDEDYKAYYDAHQDRFKSKESFDARHILVAVKGGPAGSDTGLTDDEAKAKIAKLQAELKAGKKLADLVKDYFDDPGSKDKDGLYENISFGSFAPEFEDAVRKQTVGQVGEAVKTSYGYHLIQVEKITPSHVLPFDEVKDKAKQAALQAKQEQVMKAYIDEIKKNVPYAEGEAAEKAADKTPAKAGKRKTGAKK